jgi:mono/diheme cytochrome c family protein
MGCSTFTVRGSTRLFCLVVLAPVAAAAGGFLWAATPAAPRSPARLSFNKDIRPILSENCFACHGPDHANRQAGLRLDTFEQSTEELDSGTRAIVPEDIAASELIARVISDDPDSVMPPPEAKIGRLSPEQVATLERWIAEGAKYEPHWAFVSPVKAEVTDAAAGIDADVATKLAARGLAHQPEADRVTLIRRVSFDASRSRSLRRRLVARRLRETARPAVGEPAIWRADGRRLDGSGSLFRQLWIPGRPPAARHVAVARLGHQSVQ